MFCPVMDSNWSLKLLQLINSGEKLYLIYILKDAQNELFFECALGFVVKNIVFTGYLL